MLGIARVAPPERSSLALPYALIHPSAWKGYSKEFIISEASYPPA
jgi:hypothetical protein